MKKFIAVIAIIMSSACTIEVKSAEPTTAPEPTDTLSPVEREFVDSVRDTGAGVGSTDEDLIEGGHMICEAIDEYGVLFTMTSLLEDAYDPEMVGSVVGASVASFCPENAQLIEDALNDYDSTSA